MEGYAPGDRWGTERLPILWSEEVDREVLEAAQAFEGAVAPCALRQSAVGRILAQVTVSRERCLAAVGKSLRRLLESGELVWVGRDGLPLPGQIPLPGERIFAVQVGEGWAAS